MTDPAIIRATYADWKTVPSRKVLRLIFEVPLEHQDKVLRMLGAPSTDSAEWYAIARLNKAHEAPSTNDGSSSTQGSAEPSPSKSADQGKDKSRTFTRSQIAALKIRDADFIDWLCARYPAQWDRAAGEGESVSAVKMADITLKFVLEIDSKSQIDSIPAKARAWDQLLASYDYRDRVRS